MNSNFNEDLSREAKLGQYLDGIYKTVLPDFPFERVSDANMQHQGIDLVLKHRDEEVYIDEKAQLDYVDKDLPTFAFELSYQKDGSTRKGWLFDASKKTNKYFLITGIALNKAGDFSSGFASCKITSVSRRPLIKLLAKKGLTPERIGEIHDLLISKDVDGAFEVPELNPYTEGKFYRSRSNKAECPINIVLKLDFLVKSEVAKRIR